MKLGVTVGDSVPRVEATADDFAFAEFSVGESASVPDKAVRSDLLAATSATDSGLCVHLPFDQVVATPVSQLNDAIVDYLAELLAWAGSVEAEKAVLHATMRNPHDTDLRPTFAEQLTAISEAGADVGVEVVVENVGHQKRGLPLSVLGDLARETDTPVCFDVGHAYMEDGNDGVERFLRTDGDLISHLHVHDVRSRGDTHIPIGAGEVDYGIVGRHLPEFDGTVAVEVFTDDVVLLQDSARRVREFLIGES